MRKIPQQTEQERIARVMAKRAGGIFLDQREIENLRIVEKNIHSVLLLADARCDVQNRNSNYGKEQFLILNKESKRG